MQLRSLFSGLLLALSLASPSLRAQAVRPVPIYDFKTHQSNARMPTRGLQGLRPRATPAATPSACTLITFEGLADLGAIPTFQGVSLPSWLSIIENNAGGSGNFANEPSPVTIAFWLYGNPTSQVVDIPNGASSISFDYSSYYPITVTAFDANNQVVSTATGPANFDFSTYVYDIWSPISVKSGAGSNITSIRIDGYANYTGIDDLDVCQTPVIDSVEITQAIQQYQTLDDLKGSLAASGEPPVPVISNKPAVLRVYFAGVQNVTNATVRLSGVASQTKMAAIQPNCPDLDQRAGNNGCQSMDFYFTPPSGAWQATLDVLDAQGNVAHTDTLNVNSRDTDSLRLRGVSICDAKDAAGTWLCADGSDLIGKTALLAKIAPTSTVSLDVTSITVREDLATFADVDKWWDAAIADVDANYGVFDYLGDLVSGRRSTYYGQIRPSLPGGTGGMAHNIPSRGAGSRTSVIRLGGETNVQVVAHETGHTLGLKHTNTDVPTAAGVPPGCYNLAADPSTDWPFGTNNIQSTARLEYGFDVAARAIIDPNNTFDVMSYCVPRWVSPLRYKTMIATLGGGAAGSPSRLQAAAVRRDAKAHPAAAAAPPGSYWQVRGTLQAGAVQFRPLFVYSIPGDSTPGSGTYALVELNSANQALFTRAFTPEVPEAESAGPEVTYAPGFAQVIPFNAAATAIVVLDPGRHEIGRIRLGGSAPTVAVTVPAAGFTGTGTEAVKWTYHVAAGATATSNVQYSSDGGSTWTSLGVVTNASSLPVDFDRLAGSAAARIQVLVSDGANSIAATSPAFTVPRKAPSVIAIDTPAPKAAQPAVDPVYLSGTAYDPDDGVLAGRALKWSSNLQGPLGSGSPLSTRLQPGNHTITFTATDSDGNARSATTQVLVGGAPPAVVLQAAPLDPTGTTNCEAVTITAAPGAKGAPLSTVQFSTNGGLSYGTLPLTSLPYKFVSPGNGFVHIVARAYDTSGQMSAKDVSFLTAGACQNGGQPLIQGAVASKGLQSPGVYAVAVKFTNTGGSTASNLRLNVSARRLAGTGTPTFAGTNPVGLPDLPPGGSALVTLLFNVPSPNTITRFSIAEAGSLSDVFNTTETFSVSQQVIP